MVGPELLRLREGGRKRKQENKGGPGALHLQAAPRRLRVEVRKGNLGESWGILGDLQGPCMVDHNTHVWFGPHAAVCSQQRHANSTPVWAAVHDGGRRLHFRDSPHHGARALLCPYRKSCPNDSHKPPPKAVARSILHSFTPLLHPLTAHLFGPLFTTATGLLMYILIIHICKPVAQGLLDICSSYVPNADNPEQCWRPVLES